jgi:hypothetical protein
MALLEQVRPNHPERGSAADRVVTLPSVGLSLRPHPVAFLRGELACDGYLRCADL